MTIPRRRLESDTKDLSARNRPSSYHRPVANVQLAVLILVTVAALVFGVSRFTPGAPRRRTRALVGLVPGVLGAILVLTTNVDLVPDELEAQLLPIVVLAISGIVAIITIRSLARR
jgi:uncharacterized membrane protein